MSQCWCYYLVFLVVAGEVGENARRAGHNAGAITLFFWLLQVRLERKPAAHVTMLVLLPCLSG
ncbi:MAG: hypothetical protein ACK56F_25595, partial [bacterium]